MNLQSDIKYPEPVATGCLASLSRQYAMAGAVSMERALGWCAAIFAGLGFCGNDAAYLAEGAVTSQARGRHAHGLLQLAKMAQAVQDGKIDPMARPDFHESGSLISMDAQHVSGPLALRAAISRGKALADSHRIACVSASGCGWLGALDFGVSGLAEKGYLVQLFSCVNHRIMSAFGGVSGVVGTNAVCIGIPGDPALVLDTATSVVPYNALDADRVRREPVGLNQSGTETCADREILSGGTLHARGGDQNHILATFAVLAECLCIASGKPLPEFSEVRQGFHLTIHSLDNDARRRIQQILVKIRNAPPSSDGAVRLPADQARGKLVKARCSGLTIERRLRAELDALAGALNVPPL